ncbi:hypothetical protein PVIIG_06172 [Plasmodium vivax India VII]|uniref:Uncharacterized protein n=1 Tax=Plasmodium vivax India VII TaxID=1077284 RepID=A0A0J9S2F0_PLAVI|nr:hypothetical protein PVIIG_06172 [Plasmodium vivax India VII]
MAQCQRGSSDTYLNYACYTRLKDKFDVINPGDTGYRHLGKAKEKIKVNHENYPIKYEEFFKNLASYLQQDGIFVEADRIIPCRYINYLLNKKLIKDDMYLSNPNYGILKDFVKEFHRSKSSIGDGEICSSEIQFLEYEEYKKMELLYDLYDKYITLTQRYKPYKYDACNILSKFIMTYNDSINSYQKTDEKLIKKLIDLKELIGKNVLPNNEGCQKKITHFTLSDIENKKIEEENRKRIEEQRQEQEKQERLEREKQERLEREKQEQLEQEKQLEHKQLERVELQRHLQTRPLLPNSNEQRQQYGVPYIPASSLPPIHESGLAEPYNSQSFGESEHSEIKMEQSQDQDVLGQMQNAFSSILDPSLEEEEDDSVKFLEPLEDFHQDILEIFRNMMVGLLDIVQ